MTKQIFIEANLTPCASDWPENLRMRIQYAEINKGGYGFTVDLWEGEIPALSCGLLVSESVLISLYLLKVCGRKPAFCNYTEVPEIWQTKMLCRFYDSQGGTDASAAIWVDDNALWVGIDVDGIIAKARLDDTQLEGMMRLADAMDEAFKA